MTRRAVSERRRLHWDEYPDPAFRSCQTLAGLPAAVHDWCMVAENMRPGIETAEELTELAALLQQVQQIAAKVEQMAAQMQQATERIEQIWQRIQ